MDPKYFDTRHEDKLIALAISRTLERPLGEDELDRLIHSIRNRVPARPFEVPLRDSDPRSSCVVAFHGHQVLVVEEHGGFGLPGGKAEPGETPLYCAQRELFEETGIVADPNYFIEIAVGYAGGHQCTAFWFTRDVTTRTYDPTWKWRYPHELSGSGSRFPDFYTDLWPRLLPVILASHSHG